MAFVKPTIVTGDLQTFGGDLLENGIRLSDKYAAILHTHDDTYLKKENNTFKFVESTGELNNQGSIEFISDSANSVKLSFDSLSGKGHGLVLSNINDNTDLFLSVNGDIYAKNFKGNSDTATILKSGAKINGVNFDGSRDIVIVDDSKLPISGGKLGGPLSIIGNISSSGLKVQSITGTDNTASINSDLYLQYGVNKKIFLGAYGTHFISENGAEYTGNAATATTLKNPKTITFNGDVAGAFSLDGSSDTSCKLTIVGEIDAAKLNGYTITDSYKNNSSNALVRTDAIGDIYTVGISTLAEANDSLNIKYAFYDSGDGFIRKCSPNRMKEHLSLNKVDNTSDIEKKVLSANKLTTGRTISISGAVEGSILFDGSSDVVINTVSSNVAWDSIKDRPNTFDASYHTHDVEDVPNLSSVAKTGNFYDLVNYPKNISAFVNDTGFITKFTDITGNAATATKASQDTNGNIIIDTYALKNNTVLTGIPTAPTAEVDTNTDQIATTAFVKSAISKSYDITHDQLDTINRLTEILSNGEEPATSLINGLSNKLDKNATAIAAKKLEFGANINDTLFDGSVNIKISNLIGIDDAGSNTKPSDYLYNNGQLKYIGIKSSSIIGLNTSEAGETSAIIALNKSVDTSLNNVEIAIGDNGSIFTRYGTGDIWSDWTEYVSKDKLVSDLSKHANEIKEYISNVESFNSIPTVNTTDGSNINHITNVDYVNNAISNATCDWNKVINKPNSYVPEVHTHDILEVKGLSNVAISGSYNDLKDIPTKLPANGGTADVANSVPWTGITNKPEKFEPINHKHWATEIRGLSNVAISGSYNDLKDIPQMDVSWPDIQNKPKINGIDISSSASVEIPISKEIIMFASSDSRWSQNSDGNYELTINTTKDALNIFRDVSGSYISVMVTQKKTNTGIVFISKDRFSGYIILI